MRVCGVLVGMLRKMGSHTPAGNFSSKRGNKNFYKGKGAKRYGKVNNRGQFVQSKFPNWFMPNMDNFPLKPYVGYGGGLPGKDALQRMEQVDTTQ
eukprot:CAMPEP_0183352036 /NCGR_PEP_ID=MMETSP0164_2-20130417/27058_1 /TAXON_ID=221442 /ORGANISM="Coccolithus pelagicus ssp braarudi, Strain PLY182g" /LENGTH=94 /DNA_ID=CAMNT_0025524381 /DNA_START=94 /DNA_END=378 /DNA_ORIENTATION=-